MQLELYKKPKKVVIVEGFPGFGLVSTIATEFLINHLKTELIGIVKADEIPALAAVHDNKVVQPLGIFYNKQYNLVVLHAISNVTGLEWKAADIVKELAKQLDAKEVISIEGVGSSEVTKSRVFFHTSNDKKAKALEKAGLDQLKEGIIIGVTGALLLKAGKTPHTCLLAETHSNLPDSKAAAEVIKALDSYLGLKIDYKPLLKTASAVESKVKGLLDKAKSAAKMQQKKRLDYLG